MNTLTQNVVVIIILLFVLTAVPVFAQNFVPLEPDVGLETGKGVSGYVQSVVNFVIGIAIALAVIMITIGGVKYMMTGSVVGKTDARQTIGAAIGGLVLALAAVLILQTINPDILNIDITRNIKELSDKAKTSEDTDTQQNTP